MVDRLASLFHTFAQECRESSPIYARLSQFVANDSELLKAIAPVVGVRFNANLFFAAARYVALKQRREIPGDPSAFRDFCLESLRSLEALIVSRITQTNEVDRCSYLLLGFETVFRRFGKPLALLEIGASAGLNLRFDRYRYDFGPYGSVGPAESRVVLTPKVLSGSPPVPRRMPQATWRLGIDINPLNPSDASDRLWLQACVWPEHHDRQRRLEAALDVAVESPVRVLAGNAVDLLLEAALEAPAHCTLVVYHTNTLGYFTPDERERLAIQMAELRRARETVWLSGEGPAPADGFEVALRINDLAESSASSRVLAHIVQHARAFKWLGDSVSVDAPSLRL